MTLDDYQRAALRTINPALDDRDRLLDASAGLAEEAGAAYKNIDAVMKQQQDLVEIVAELKQIVCVKG